MFCNLINAAIQQVFKEKPLVFLLEIHAGEQSQKFSVWRHGT